jgi:hypothetical protein
LQGKALSFKPLYGLLLLALSILFGVFAIREHNDLATILQKSPTQARVEKVWHVASARGGGTTFGTISYERATPAGRVDCNVTLRFDGRVRPPAPGQWISIIPRADSCYEPILVGYNRYPFVLAALSLAAFLTGAFLLFGFARRVSSDHMFGRDTT